MAGTNGKGTFTEKTALALHHSGYRAGHFISPHVSSVRERVQIGGEKISKDFFIEFLAFFEEMKKNGDDLGISFFDFMTVMALKYWELERVDVAVMEVGLGGRLDSTNILRSQNIALSVITGIGLDHMSFLGDTVEEIAGKN